LPLNPLGVEGEMKPVLARSQGDRANSVVQNSAASFELIEKVDTFSAFCLYSQIKITKPYV
jgi:hypothetical protein